ncbi:serine protease, partial [Streptomyces sp. ok210]|uniref:S1 family peptidase n=1 Tax=Streptomyces sp. ok210 TaxID=1761905 RepID=UPI0008F2C8CA
MRGLDLARVAEVLVRRGESATYGSGYRISSKLILTAGHLMDPQPCGVQAPSITVMLGTDAVELPATLVWRATGRDLALLQLDNPPNRVKSVTFGRLPHVPGSVEFSGVGFPAFMQRPASEGVNGLRRRDSKRVGGFVQLGSNMKSGQLDLTITTALPVDSETEDPWKGISGTTLFTKDSGLLIGVQARRLPAAGTGSVEAESIADAIEDPNFRKLLVSNGVPTHPATVELSGQTNADPMTAVVEQQELIDGLGGFKQNLTPEHLPFVSPGIDHEAEPQNLFHRLVESDGRGILLVGAAGTGKTRSGFEVGRIALEADWRVLHVRPGRESSITDQISGQIFKEDGDVLVVIDYLNEYLKENDSQLDLSALRHRVLPEALRRGIHVALLASVRPGWLQMADRVLLHELFDEVVLRQDEEFQRLVANNALTTLAPTAVRQLGSDRMKAICGHRPIITLLIARELERRAVAGLTIPENAGLRASGDLSGWLERRLKEDTLTVPSRIDTFKPASASDRLVAAAAAAAACPQPRAEVIAAADAALHRTSSDAPSAESIVATLTDLGWLESEGDTLTVAHDVVCDQLVESVILPERNNPNRDHTHVLLSGCLTSPRTIGRYAMNLDRLMNDLMLAGRAESVSPMLNAWFTDNATAIGHVMRLDANAGSYALGAVCSGPPWSNAAVECWQKIVGPWLDEFGDSVVARHILYRGLRNLPPDGALRLVPTALAWLKTHGLRREASYVLSPLLSRVDLAPEPVEQAVTRTLTWLDHHATSTDAGFVLNPLLSRGDLGVEDSERAVGAALAWLDEH